MTHLANIILALTFGALFAFGPGYVAKAQMEVEMIQ